MPTEKSTTDEILSMTADATSSSDNPPHPLAAVEDSDAKVNKAESVEAQLRRHCSTVQHTNLSVTNS